MRRGLEEVIQKRVAFLESATEILILHILMFWDLLRQLPNSLTKPDDLHVPFHSFGVNLREQDVHNLLGLVVSLNYGCVLTQRATAWR